MDDGILGAMYPMTVTDRNGGLVHDTISVIETQTRIDVYFAICKNFSAHPQRKIEIATEDNTWKHFKSTAGYLTAMQLILPPFTAKYADTDAKAISMFSFAMLASTLVRSTINNHYKGNYCGAN